jgi:hypothetical protein
VTPSRWTTSQSLALCAAAAMDEIPMTHRVDEACTVRVEFLAKPPSL